MSKSRKTISFNKDNWSGETGSLTYMTDLPLAFEIPDYGRFRLEHIPLAPEEAEALDGIDLGEWFHIRGEEWGPDYSLGRVEAKTGTLANLIAQTDQIVHSYSGNPLACAIERDTYGVEGFTDGEKLLIAAARILFNTV